MFLAGQISTRLGWFDTLTVVITYALFVLFFWVIGFIIAVAVTPQNGSGAAVILFWFPYFLAFIYVMLLRVRFVAHYHIPEDPMETFCLGFWCSPCSLCQMARHMVGYTRVFDGDGLLDGGMNYQLNGDSIPGNIRINSSSSSSNSASQPLQPSMNVAAARVAVMSGPPQSQQQQSNFTDNPINSAGAGVGAGKAYYM